MNIDIKSIDDEPEKSPEEVYLANLKSVRKQKARFRRLEKIISRNVFLIPFCVIFTVFSAVSIFASTLSDHFEYISYDMITIKKQIDTENNRTIQSIGLMIKKEISYKELAAIAKLIGEKKIYKNRSQYVKLNTNFKIENFFNLITENFQSIYIIELEFYFDYYILKSHDFLDLNRTNSKEFFIYEIHSGIWKYCNYLSDESLRMVRTSKCSNYVSRNTDQAQEKKIIDLADPEKDMIRMHNAAACCTIVSYFLMIFSWSTGIFAFFTKRVPLTLATSVLSMLNAVFLALMLAIFHRKIITINKDLRCGELDVLLQIICQNRIINYGYSLGMCWLGLLFSFLNSICWYHISKMQKILLAHGHYY